MRAISGLFSDKLTAAAQYSNGCITVDSVPVEGIDELDSCCCHDVQRHSNDRSTETYVARQHQE
jgi:hypothetical protein